MVVGDPVTGATPGGLFFADAGAALAQDPTLLFWDDTNNRLGIGNAAPATALHVTGTIRASAGLTLDFLTAGRVPFAGASGAITDDADLTFATDTLTATKISTTSVTNSALTSGRVPVASTGGLMADFSTLTYSLAAGLLAAAEDSGTTTVLRPVTARRTTSGTAAAGLGTGIAFEIEDAAGNAQATGSLDFLWQDAANASEDGIFDLRVYVGGTETDLLRVAGAAGVVTPPDTDFTLAVGRFLVDSRTTDTVNLSHRDNTGTTSWAIQFGATGFVGVNALTGSSGALRANNVTKFAWSTAGLSFFNATIATQQNITGSRGGNAALADLLTKLATIGLITDGTSA